MTKLVGLQGAQFGIRPVLPLRGFPEGRVRLRMRPEMLVTAFVRTGTETRQYIVFEKEGYWEPGILQAVNVRDPRKA